MGKLVFGPPFTLISWHSKHHGKERKKKKTEKNFSQQHSPAVKRAFEMCYLAPEFIFSWLVRNFFYSSLPNICFLPSQTCQSWIENVRGKKIMTDTNLLLPALNQAGRKDHWRPLHSAVTCVGMKAKQGRKPQPLLLWWRLLLPNGQGHGARGEVVWEDGSDIWPWSPWFRSNRQGPSCYTHTKHHMPLWRTGALEDEFEQSFLLYVQP